MFARRVHYLNNNLITLLIGMKGESRYIV